MKRYILILLLSLVALGAEAKVEVHDFDSRQQEESYQRLIEELRCLVCQNQNLADSNAELAQDLRQKTYEMVKSGMDDKAIIEYMVNRYGDFVLYRPPVRSSTMLLWVGPFIILIAGIFIMIGVVRRQRREQTDSVDAAELERVGKLLKQDDKS